MVVLLLNFVFLVQVTCLLNYLRANHYKLMVARRQVDSSGPPRDSISEFITHAADKAVSGGSFWDWCMY